MKEVDEARNSGIQRDTMEEDEAEDMDNGDLDLDALEVECRNVGSGYVPREQIKLLQ